MCISRYLRCSKSATELACPGAGELDAEGNFQLTKSHVDGCKEPFLKERSFMREALFLKTKEKPSNPIDVFSYVSKHHKIAAQLTAYPELKTSMLNWRNETLPSLPTHISEVADALQCDQWARELTYDMVVADAETGTVEESTHRLQAWSVEIERRSQRGEGDVYTEWHVVFGTPTFASKFTDQVFAFIDCTYDSVSNTEGGYQLFTLMIEYHGEVFPVAWSLMSRKTEEAYYEVLKAIVDRLLPGFRPSKVMTDFEDALQNAIRRVFLEAEVKGCYFHHCHALLKNRQRFSVMTRVKKHHPQQLPEAYGFERDLMNLALLPPEFIEEGFDQLAESLTQNAVLQEIMGAFFDYYRAQWIQRKGPASYSVYKETRRTNNVVERYHRKLKSLTSTRPEIVKFMIALKAVQEDAHRDTLLVDHGKKPYRNQDAKWNLKEQALQKAWENLGDLAACTSDIRKNRITSFLNALSPHTALAMDRGATEEVTELQANDVDIPLIDQELEPMVIEEIRVEHDEDANQCMNDVDTQKNDLADEDGSKLRKEVKSEQGKHTIGDHGERTSRGSPSEYDRDKSDDSEDETADTLVAYECLLAENLDTDYVENEDTKNCSFDSEAVEYADENSQSDFFQYECFENESEGLKPENLNKQECTTQGFRKKENLKSDASGTMDNHHINENRCGNSKSKDCGSNEDHRENVKSVDCSSNEGRCESENFKKGEVCGSNEHHLNNGDRREDKILEGDACRTNEDLRKTEHFNTDTPGTFEDLHKNKNLHKKSNSKSEDCGLNQARRKSETLENSASGSIEDRRTSEKLESANRNDKERSQDCDIVRTGEDDIEICGPNVAYESFTKSPLATKSHANLEMIKPSTTKGKILKTKQAIESYANIQITKPSKVKGSVVKRRQAVKSHVNLKTADKIKSSEVKENLSNNVKTIKANLGIAKPRVTNVTILKGAQNVLLRKSTLVSPTSSNAACTAPMGVLWPIQFVTNSSPHVVFGSPTVTAVTESPYFSNTIAPRTELSEVTKTVQTGQKGKQRPVYIPIPIAPKPPTIHTGISLELAKQQHP